MNSNNPKNNKMPTSPITPVVFKKVNLLRRKSPPPLPAQSVPPADPASPVTLPPALPLAPVTDTPSQCQPLPVPVPMREEVIWRSAGDLNLTPRFRDLLDRDEDLVEKIAATVAVHGKLPLEYAFPVWEKTGEPVDGCSRLLGALKVGSDIPVPTVNKSFASFAEAKKYALAANNDRRQNNNRVILLYVARNTEDLDPLLYQRVYRCAHPKADMGTVHACTMSRPPEFLTNPELAADLGVSPRTIFYAIKIIRQGSESLLTQVLSGRQGIRPAGGRLTSTKSPKVVGLPKCLVRALPEKYKMHIAQLAKEQNVDPSDIAAQLIIERLAQKLGSGDDPFQTESGSQVLSPDPSTDG